MPGKLYEVNRSRRETKIQFDVHLVGRHKELVKLMTTTLAGILKTRNLSPSNNATLRNYSVAVGGYRSSVGGFQRSIFALESGNPNVGTRRPHEGGSYPPKLGESDMVDELDFDHRSPSGAVHRIKIWDRTVVVTPPPTRNLEGAYLEVLGIAASPPVQSMLESASEYITSARHDFVENRYGTSAHNIYYSMLYSLRALLASLGREHREIEHTPAPKQLATILHDIKTGSSPLLKSHATTASSNLFSDIDSKGIVQAFKDARFLREEADYGTNFEGNAYLTTYSRITLRAAELLGIATMLHDGGVMYTRRRGHKYQLDLVRASRLHSAPTEAEHLVLSGSVMTRGFRMHHFATILFLKYSLRIFPFQKHDKFIMISQDLRDVWFLPDSHEKPAGYAEVNRSNFETEQELLARVFVNRYSSGDVKVQFKSLNNLFDLWFRQDGRFYVSLVDGTSMEGIESSVRAIEGDLSSCCDDVYRSASLLLMR